MFGGLEVAALTYGWSSFASAYGIAQTTMAAGLLQGPGSWGSRFHKLLRSPVIAGGITLFSSFALGLAKPWFLGMGMTAGGLSFGAVAALGLAGYFTGRVIARLNSSNNIFQRGTVVLDEAQSAALRRKRGKGAVHAPGLDTPVTIAGIPLTSPDKDRPLQVETQHFKFVGITGAGKTTAIQEVLDTALARGDRAIIADPDGVYSRRYYDPSRDAIFNPFDPRSRQWNIFSEIKTEEDIEQLARALIPDTGSTADLIWHEHARTFFSDVVRQLRRTPEVQTEQSFAPDHATTKELYRTITQESVKNLGDLLKDTASEPLLDPNNARMFGSVRAIASSAVRSLRYIAAQKDAQPLSVRDWVSQGKAGTGPKQGGVLFIPYKAGEIAALRSTISAWMRLGIFEAMDRPEGDQRLWFVVDELGALGKIDGLTDALTRIRKFGGRVVLGFQSIDQVEGIYGKYDANALVENCGNTLVLRCGTGDNGGTSKFASELIGQREMLRITSSTTRQPGALFSSTSHSEHYHIEYAVMPSEIEQLQNLHGYLRIGSWPEWMRVRVEKKESERPAYEKSWASSSPARAPPLHAPSNAATASAAPFVSSTATAESNFMNATASSSSATAASESAALRPSHRPADQPQVPLQNKITRVPNTKPRAALAVGSNGEVAWYQDGKDFTAKNTSPESVASLVSYVKEKGIRHIKFNPQSNREFRSAVFDAALKENIDVYGYSPTPEQRARLIAQKSAAAEKNTEAAAEANNSIRRAGLLSRAISWFRRNVSQEAVQSGGAHGSGTTADVHSEDSWHRENSIRAAGIFSRSRPSGGEMERMERPERLNTSNRSEQFEKIMRRKAAEAVAYAKAEREQGTESESPFERRGDSFYEKGTDKLAFEKRGRRYVTTREDALAVGGIVEKLGAATSRTLILDGTDTFKRQAWLEASVRGYETSGYTVRDGDMEALHERFEERERAEKAGSSTVAGKDNEKGGSVHAGEEKTVSQGAGKTTGSTAGVSTSPTGEHSTGVSASSTTGTQTDASAGQEQARTKRRSFSDDFKIELVDKIEGKSEAEQRAIIEQHGVAYGYLNTFRKYLDEHPEARPNYLARKAAAQAAAPKSDGSITAPAGTATPKDTLGVHVAHPPASAGAGSAVKTLDSQTAQAVMTAAKQTYTDGKPPPAQNGATASAHQRLDNSR